MVGGGVATLAAAAVADASAMFGDMVFDVGPRVIAGWDCLDGIGTTVDAVIAGRASDMAFASP